MPVSRLGLFIRLCLNKVERKLDRVSLRFGVLLVISDGDVFAAGDCDTYYNLRSKPKIFNNKIFI